MNSGMVRWKITPSYSGRLASILPVRGFFHGFVPLARAMKLATVLGALSGNNSHFRSPAVVWRTAAGGPEGAAALLVALCAVAGAALFLDVWPLAVTATTSRVKMHRRSMFSPVRSRNY